MALLIMAPAVLLVTFLSTLLASWLAACLVATPLVLPSSLNVLPRAPPLLSRATLACAARALKPMLMAVATVVLAMHSSQCC